MPRKRLRVRDLAAEAGLDLDETIVTLWDAGIDEVEDGGDLIPAQLARAARRALGLESTRDQFKVDYWLEVTGLSRPELAEQLSTKTGIRLSTTARRIPKNSFRHLRRMFAEETAI